MKRKYSFRERAPEWVLSAGLVLWGYSVLINPELFTSAITYKPLLTLLSQNMWAYLTICIGLFRLAALTINGMWRPTTHFRAIGSAASVTIWASLVIISLFNLPERAPYIAVYGMLLAFDMMALWWAAGDAKLADIIAKAGK
jgi:hypothetical protein